MKLRALVMGIWNWIDHADHTKCGKTGKKIPKTIIFNDYIKNKIVYTECRIASWNEIVRYIAFNMTWQDLYANACTYEPCKYLTDSTRHWLVKIFVDFDILTQLQSDNES